MLILFDTNAPGSFYWFFDGRPGIEFQKFFWGKNRNDEVPRLGGVKGSIKTKKSTPVLLLASILQIGRAIGYSISF